jgi:hypothetical protein
MRFIRALPPVMWLYCDVVSKTDIATEYMFKGISWLAKTMECLFGGFFEASVYSIYQL